MSSILTKRACVIGTGVNVGSLPDFVRLITEWARHRESKSVFLTNVHSLITARSRHDFGDALSNADLVIPDGAPVAFMMRAHGSREQQRVSGPDLMLEYCRTAEESSPSVFLYGGSPATLECLRKRLSCWFPALRIAGQISPPFRPLTESEEERDVDIINRSGAGVIWVGLGCPKQELWIHNHRGRIHGVMIGVGAAFDFHAGTVRRAPLWMQHSGLEWVHRLLSEPKRLWRRYLVTNTVFIVLAVIQIGKNLLTRRT